MNFYNVINRAYRKLHTYIDSLFCNRLTYSCDRGKNRCIVGVKNNDKPGWTWCV